MKNKIKKPKIMCPIRDWASLEACKNYADEVYFSVSSLSLRAKSNNLKLNELQKFVEKCKNYKIKPFL
ncbi:MAG: U32 family peptidase, partial [Parcubacteria group bacterium]|nr:U32 family peptidase [Parcubacteria group bacterium]